MRRVQIYQIDDRGKSITLEVHPLYPSGYAFQGEPTKMSNREVEARLTQLRTSGIRVIWAGERDPDLSADQKIELPARASRLRGNSASANLKKESVMKTNKPKRFHGQSLIGSIHWLGKHGFSIDQASEILARSGFEVTRGTVRSHIGCAVRGPKVGLADRTNHHRQVVAQFPKTIAAKLKTFIKQSARRSAAA